MKTIFSICLLCILMTACSDYIDDSKKNCTSDCTTISGWLITENGSAPVNGVDLRMDWIVIGELGGTYRIIKDFRTDNNGYFSFDFYVKELELRHNGGYQIKYLENNDKYCNLYKGNNSYPTIGIISLNKRDTIINVELLLPKKSTLLLKLSNPLIETYCNLYYKYGNLKSGNYYVNPQSFSSKDQSAKFYEVAGNQINYLEITKKIGGKNVVVKDSLYVPLNDTIIYEIK